MPFAITFAQALLGDARGLAVRFTRVRSIRQCRAAGATESRRAQRYRPRSRNEASAFRELVEEAVLVQTRPGHHFFNASRQA